MNLAEQLLLTPQKHANNEPTINVMDYMHSRDDLRNLLHQAAMAAQLFGGSAETILAIGMGWILDGIKDHGMPDDIQDLPTFTAEKPAEEDTSYA